MDLAPLHTLLADLNGAEIKQHFLKRFVGIKVGLRISLFLTVDRLEDADCLTHFLDAVVFRNVNHVGSVPIKLRLVNNIRPTGRIIIVFINVRCTGD